MPVHNTKSEWATLLRALIRHPIKTIPGLLVAIAMLLSAGVPVWREQRQYQRLGRKLGIYGGKVVSRTYGPGESPGFWSPELRVTSLRRGSPEDVLRHVSRRAAAAGYRARTDPASPDARRHFFTAPPGHPAPDLTVWLYPAPETIDATEIEVPAGSTGAIYMLREYRLQPGRGRRPN